MHTKIQNSLMYINAIYLPHTSSTLKLMPLILLHWLIISKVDAGDMVVEI